MKKGKNCLLTYRLLNCLLRYRLLDCLLRYRLQDCLQRYKLLAFSYCKKKATGFPEVQSARLYPEIKTA